MVKLSPKPHLQSLVTHLEFVCVSYFLDGGYTTKLQNSRARTLKTQNSLTFTFFFLSPEPHPIISISPYTNFFSFPDCSLSQITLNSTKGKQLKKSTRHEYGGGWESWFQGDGISATLTTNFSRMWWGCSVRSFFIPRITKRECTTNELFAHPWDSQAMELARRWSLWQCVTVRELCILCLLVIKYVVFVSIVHKQAAFNEEQSETKKTRGDLSL